MHIKNIGEESIHTICSSQVIFTLSSVVKELVENSIDANANEIKIKLVENGIKLIEVNDNGKGIKKMNFENVCARHATSKISEFNDIQNSLNTLGFRGEALNSLCMLSDLNITTKNDESEHGYLLKFDKLGRLVHEEPIARLRGTTVSCENIFKNIPIRKKDFIKNIKTQLSQLLLLMQQYAIIYHRIKFSITNIVSSKGMTKNINLLMTNQSDNIIKSFYSIFGRKNIGNLIEFNIDSDCWKINGFISDNNCGRRDKDLQFYYMNSRPIHILKNVNKIINTIYREFNSRLYPIIVINILSDTKNIDINVTPDKREVFFIFENEMCEQIKSYLVKLLTPKTNNLIDTQIGDYFLKANNILSKSNNLKMENDYEKDCHNLNQKSISSDDSYNKKCNNNIYIKKEMDNTNDYYNNDNNKSNYNEENILKIEDKNNTEIYYNNQIPNEKNYLTNMEFQKNSNNNNNNNSNFENSYNFYKNEISSEDKNMNQENVNHNIYENKTNEYNYPTFEEKEKKQQRILKNDIYSTYEKEDYYYDSISTKDKGNITHSYNSDYTEIKNININDKKIYNENKIPDIQINNNINSSEYILEYDMVKQEKQEKQEYYEYEMKNIADNSDIYEFKIKNNENKKMYECETENIHNNLDTYENKLENDKNNTVYEYKLENDTNENMNENKSKKSEKENVYEYKLENDENNMYEYKLKNDENNIYEYKLENDKNNTVYEYKLENDQDENIYEYKLENDKYNTVYEYKLGNNENDNVCEYKLKSDEDENIYKCKLKNGDNGILNEYTTKNIQNKLNNSPVYEHKMKTKEVEQDNLNYDSIDYSIDDLKENIRGSCIKSIPIDINMYINREKLKSGYDYDQIHVINLTNSEKIKNNVFHKMKDESKLNNYLCLTDNDQENDYENLFNNSLNIKESISTTKNSNYDNEDIDFSNIDENQKDLYFKSNLFDKLKICGQFNRGFVISKINLLYFKNQEEKNNSSDNNNNCSNNNCSNNNCNNKNDYALFIIDQHAADEKSNFEKYNKTFTMKSQKLISKINLQLSPAQIHLIQKYFQIFLENGFEVEIVEEPIQKKRKLNNINEEEEILMEVKVYLLSLPVFNGKILEIVDFMSLLHHLTEHPLTFDKKSFEIFKENKNHSNQKVDTWFNYNFPRPQKVWRILASKACRNAIMVGNTLNISEMIKIKKKLSVLKNPWNCPHGRPTIKYIINSVDIKNCFKNYYLKLYDEISNLILTKNYETYKYLFHNHIFFLIMSTKPLLGPILKFH
ncbi:DNA mismatch repair protein PMS1, putative [Plasmodium gallinaceum]|uniref:DNA mismatch repair protein PMS1, putative n=1 Tax=Plasmodium gallinaceum TaxID=5849 RepID=A0A1J1GLI0_PLAGA|nr:DNA mismatch repair protein PMS1, putative [Plasmodium gallinaceum]CRG93280.1 DNA mismatch repair protein PMS1, putative [Plasmodium gallinaceum]